MLIREIVQERSQAQRKRDAGTVNDQFFTRPEVAEQFADWVRSQPWYSDVTRAFFIFRSNYRNDDSSSLDQNNRQTFF